jgi:hypothetical protein
MSSLWPVELPRFAEAFRVIIDHPDYADIRLLTGEWQMAAGAWPRMSQDVLPLLARAGRIGIIATTEPCYGMDYSTERWYGDKNYPVVYWHPDGAGGLKLATSEAGVAEWCKRRKIDRRLFDVPLSQEWHG